MAGVMDDSDPNSRYMNRLRKWRTRPDRDVSLGFLRDQFKREVEKPYKQLCAIAAVWEELVPSELAVHTRLESLNRGVLRVSVSSSSVLYELDRSLREGLEQELICQYKGPAFRRIQLRVANFNHPADPRRSSNRKSR